MLERALEEYRKSEIKQKSVSQKSPECEVSAFTFRVSFCFDEMVCWRDICVPKTFTFEDLHTAIQACLSWLNYHLYHFEYVSKGEMHLTSWPDPLTGQAPESVEWLTLAGKESVWSDAAETLLSDVFPRTRTARYKYDYGDGWELDVKLIDSKAALPDKSPCCIDGEGDNPPEDVGGEYGFERFLRIIGDSKDAEHDELVEWGKGQTWSHFDIKETNGRLAHYNDWRVRDVYANSSVE